MRIDTQPNVPALLMHGNDWSGQDVAGWWCSELLNGVRALWTGRVLLSHTGGNYKVPPWFTAGFPPCQIDCELVVAGLSTAEEVYRAAARGKWSRLRIMVFDVAEQGLTFEDAQRRLASLRLPGHVEIAEQRRVKSTEEAKAILRLIASNGGQGVMVRKPGSQYQPGRCDELLRMKPGSVLNSL